MALAFPWGQGTAAPLITTRVPLAVLGDSDSHAYHDRIWMPEGRGGAHAATTFQWTEVLGKLRPAELDLGPWGVWGSRKKLVQLLEHLPWPGFSAGTLRAPRKEDHQYNFAFAGARCEDLTEGPMRQAQRLLALMNEDPERWRHGVVVLRIGVNSFGFEDSLARLSQNPDDPVVQGKIGDCLERIDASVGMIHLKHPQVRFVLVGIFNNAHWPPNLHRWQSSRELHNIDAGLDRFDSALRAKVAADGRLGFFDDREWFASRWGGRDEAGRPAYHPSRLWPEGPVVTMSQGDAPGHAVVADGHAGLAWNLWWAQSLVSLLRRELGLPLTAITEGEIRAYVKGLSIDATW